MWNAKLLNALTMTFKRANLHKLSIVRAGVRYRSMSTSKEREGKKSHGNGQEGQRIGNTHTLQRARGVLICYAFFSCLHFHVK